MLKPCVTGTRSFGDRIIRPNVSDSEGNLEWQIRDERQRCEKCWKWHWIKPQQRTHTVALRWLQRRGESALPSSSVMRCFPWMEFRHWLPGLLLFPRWNCTFHGMGWSWSWTWRRFRSLTVLSSYKETAKGRLKYRFLHSHQLLTETTQQDRNNIRKPAQEELAIWAKSEPKP